jgi:hypothetical protein
VEGAGVLGDHVQVTAQGAEGFSVDGMGVGDAVGVWSGGVDLVVDCIRCSTVKWGLVK